jgi:hypothetical protein
MELSIHGLRSHALVGREGVRDAMWQTLRAAEAGEPGLLVLRGAAGVGKSSLARWLCERAHEAGGARVFVARHTAAQGAESGLGPMMRRHLESHGAELPAAARLAWARLGGSALDGEALAAAVGGELRPAGEARAIVRYLRACGRNRTVLLWLDDVQWAPAAVRALLEQVTGVGARLMVVATQTPEGPSVAPAECTVRLGALSEQAHNQLVGSILGLAPSVGAMVAARTLGQPLIAVHLVSDWVQRGWLVPGAGGFRLRAGVEPTVPTEVRALWARRLGLLSREARHLLELAAVLGEGTSVDLWRATATRLGLDLSSQTRDAAARAELLSVDQEGVAFAHGMLAESLVERCQEAGRAVGFHGAASEELRAIKGDVTEIARHCVGAGEHEEALPWLILSAHAAGMRSDRTSTHARLHACDLALEAAGLPENHRLHGEVRHIRLQYAFLMAELSSGDSLVDALLEQSRIHGWAKAESKTFWLRHCLRRGAGDLDGALADLARCRQIAEVHGLTEMRSLVALDGGILACISGDYDRAERLFRETLEVALSGHDNLVHQAEFRLAGLPVHRGVPAEAVAPLQALWVTWDDTVSHQARMALLNDLGVALSGVDQVAALETLWEAVALAEAFGHVDLPVVRFNLANTLLSAGDVKGANEILEQHDPALCAPFLVPPFHQLAAWSALLAGDPARAEMELAAALALARTMSRRDAAVDEVGPEIIALATGLPGVVALVEALAALGEP